MKSFKHLLYIVLESLPEPIYNTKLVTVLVEWCYKDILK